MFHPPKANRLPYYPTDPGPLYCWLCGLTLEASTWPKDRAPSFICDNKLWDKAWCRYMMTPKSRRRKFSLYMKACDLDITFTDRLQWVTLFRTIILSTNGKDLPEGYHLSGIGYMAGARNGQYLLACQDPDTACLGATRENSNTLRVSPVQHPFSNCVSKGSHLKGYPMHSRCWDLIEQRLGSLATSRLDLIVAALRKQWDEIIPRISRSSTSAAELSYNFGRYYQGLQHSYQVEDPMFIPPLNTLLQTCTDLSSANKGSRETISLNILGSKYNVPLEITYLIADCLSLRDTYNMLIAFGEKFPPNYWKRQIPTDILFELEKFDDNPFLWPYIAPKIESWGILNTYGIGNRKRILGMVDGIKRLVDTEVNKERIGKQQQNVAF